MRDGLALDNFKNSEIIYDFKGHLYEDIFDYLFQSFKTYLNLLKDDTYDVSPVAIYFTKYTTVNARAGYDGKYYIIEINRGTVEQLYNMFLATGFLADQIWAHIMKSKIF